MSRIVFHIDVNSAFLSWSAKQVLEKGYTRDIRNEVSVVWFKEKWKSIVVAASTPAKKIWIKVPMKIFEVQKILLDLNFHFYDNQMNLLHRN